MSFTPAVSRVSLAQGRIKEGWRLSLIPPRALTGFILVFPPADTKLAYGVEHTESCVGFLTRVFNQFLQYDLAINLSGNSKTIRCRDAHTREGNRLIFFPNPVMAKRFIVKYRYGYSHFCCLPLFMSAKARGRYRLCKEPRTLHSESNINFNGVNIMYHMMYILHQHLLLFHLYTACHKIW